MYSKIETTEGTRNHAPGSRVSTKNTLGTILRRWEERGRSEHCQPPSEIAEIIRLPVWPDTLRGVPNGVLRSALFGAIRRGPRCQITRELISSVDGYEIRYTGARLDQSDLDVWETLLHLARLQALGNRIETTERALLKSLDRTYGKSGREWLKKVIARLTATAVEFRHSKQTYGGSLVDEFYRDETLGCYVLVLNPQIQKLFAKDDWSQIEWEQRQALRGQPLAQWLHGFYSSHADPYPLKVETLHRLAGSETKLLKNFRHELRQALVLLDAVTKWRSSIDANDLVSVRKIPTKSQKRHLKKNKK
ncbi:plasmid replication initiator TrfA [Allochromatium vinosum]|uniref:plasmid replication initiator TrfA n=1 Tax=Allochromatium vinosum TaxID=1049 RepID=UPI001907297E|nr:plasmid replication initiator TrfA [Allochromatium vinosum]MBK1655866.1 hypothetical protein [Allochromatium vinosum]